MVDQTEEKRLGMTQAQRPGKAEAPRRKLAISPELSEVLHMLKSLEAELAPKKPATG